VHTFLPHCEYYGTATNDKKRGEKLSRDIVMELEFLRFDATTSLIARSMFLLVVRWLHGWLTT